MLIALSAINKSFFVQQTPRSLNPNNTKCSQCNEERWRTWLLLLLPGGAGLAFLSVPFEPLVFFKVCRSDSGELRMDGTAELDGISEWWSSTDAVLVGLMEKRKEGNSVRRCLQCHFNKLYWNKKVNKLKWGLELMGQQVSLSAPLSVLFCFNSIIFLSPSIYNNGLHSVNCLKNLNHKELKVTQFNR